ncbi:putative ankyrin repeat-containing domain, PGG domain, ankyrin repeat-containing domain superfamily [Helianthus annuus]|nr:putative ankyrin repeat-containing domain, PGG domain, ankyrin repeat-containing domain superfamily [Helianthus annuus]KAJ0645931.1 putative ankyrin repeat-containing domain, PGG domain, ankyrin repeat-containing domain superfamily [Helianthus annuus]KAJ0822529.1 putative ankyrin repeat-containing domain, PGG domain, ankyrin repeat-containing domain superfamily [Helianthus annuus]
METKLYEASLTGDVQALNALLHQNQLILDRLSLTAFNESPLHIAAMRGHHQFATILLTQKPKLAIALDSQRRTPLHLASANGYLEMVQEIVKAGGRDVCCFRDQDGLTPLHLAVMNERLEVVKVLVQANPDAAKEIAESGETILHMCVSYNSMESLKVLMQLWSEEELAKITDNGGNTLLHAAAINKHTQILNYLLRIASIKANGNAVNRLGLTALDILDQCPRDLKSLEIREVLMEAGVLRANDLRPALEKPSQSLILNASHNKRKGWISRIWAWYVNADHRWIENQRGILLVSALVVAGVSFYSGINPPSGFITDTKDGSLGNAVQAEIDMDKFSMFVANNSVTMITSLAIVIVLISGLPLRNKFWMWLLTLGTLLTMVSMVFSYWISLSMMTPDGYVDGASVWICLIWMSGCGVIALIHTIFFVVWVVMKPSKCMKPETNRQGNQDAGEV